MYGEKEKQRGVMEQWTGQIIKRRQLCSRNKQSVIDSVLPWRCHSGFFMPWLSGSKGSLQGSRTKQNCSRRCSGAGRWHFPVEGWAAGLYCKARSCSAASGSVLEVEQGMGQHSLFIGENFSE